MKFLVLVFLFLTSLDSHAKPLSYLVAGNIHSADIEGPHRGIAQHMIGFKGGTVVPAYLADCTLTFSHGRLAQLSRCEELVVVSPFVTTQQKRDNCLAWGTSPGGDDVCESFGVPFTDQILTGKLERIGSGEQAQVFCRAYNGEDPNAAKQIWESATRGILLEQL